MEDRRYWHGQECIVLIRAPYRKHVVRNALIRFDTGVRLVVPARALRTKATGTG